MAASGDAILVVKQMVGVHQQSIGVGFLRTRLIGDQHLVGLDPLRPATLHRVSQPSRHIRLILSDHPAEEQQRPGSGAGQFIEAKGPSVQSLPYWGITEKLCMPNPQSESLGYWVMKLNRATYSRFSQRLTALGVSFGRPFLAPDSSHIH